MEAMETILSRRSVRSYLPRPVPREAIRKLLEGAMSAPSAGNQQPWHFLVIDDRKILDAMPSVHPYSQMLREAPLAILICGDLELEKHKGFWVQDCSAAAQNLLLAAHAQNLGAVWLGVYPREDRVTGFQKMFGLPRNLVPFCIVSIGYPAEKIPRAHRYNASRVYHNEFARGWEGDHSG